MHLTRHFCESTFPKGVWFVNVLVAVFLSFFRKCKGTVNQATKNMQLVLQHCCNTSNINMQLVLQHCLQYEQHKRATCLATLLHFERHKRAICFATLLQYERHKRAICFATLLQYEQHKHSTCLATLVQNELNSNVARFTSHIKPVLQQIKFLTGLNEGGKTRSIAFQFVLL